MQKRDRLVTDNVELHIFLRTVRPVIEEREQKAKVASGQVGRSAS